MSYRRSVKNLFVLSLFLLLLAGCQSDNKSKAPGLEQAVSDSTDAHIYGYPLVSMDMTRKRLTNVAVSDESHAPMNQLLKLRTYPAVDDHWVTAPNADTLYTTA